MTRQGSRKCAGHKFNGDPCGNHAIRGGSVCAYHGGNSPQARRKSIVRSELMDWGLTDTKHDPGETLLRLVTQSADRVQLYSGLLQKAYDAADTLDPDTLDQTAIDDVFDPDTRRAIGEALTRGGTSALIGKRWSSMGAGEYGPAQIYATGEAIRGLADLEAAERDRCARLCKTALDAGIAERQVRLAEQTGALIAQVIDGVLRAQGIDPRTDQVRALVQQQLRTIEGTTA